MQFLLHSRAVRQLVVPKTGTLLYILIMRVIAKSRLSLYWQKKNCKAAEQPLRAWYDEMIKGTWKNFNELRTDYPTASIVGNDRVVFNIKGNTYRLIVKFEFKMNCIFIRFFGTHSEYDKIKADEV